MKDQNRKYLYRVLLVFAALQLYIVREWLVVFALFAVVFAIIAVAVSAGYLIQKAWEGLVHRYYD